MKCPKGWENCQICKVKFNPWLLYNERIRDNIQWENLLLESIMYFFLFIWFGWWGFLIGYTFIYLMTMNGSIVYESDFTPQEPRKKIRICKCEKGYICYYCANNIIVEKYL